MSALLAAAAALLSLTGCSNTAAENRLTERPLPSPTCNISDVAPFSCTTYLLTATPTPQTSSTRYLEYQNASAWLETEESTTQFVIERGNRRIRVPLTIDHSSATTTATPDDHFATARCGGNEDCKFRAWLADFFNEPTTLRPAGSDITAVRGARRIAAQATSRTHQYPQLTARTVNERTLLTYTPTPDGATAAAFMGGDLGVNKNGCITGGDDVLVLADTTTLNPDGSIDVDGHHYKQGQPLSLAGGQGTPPYSSRCGRGVHYWYY